MINIRERKYEIGVLRTIGMKKKYLTLQFICELLFVSFVGLAIGAGLGTISSVPISNHLLQSEIENSKEQQEGVRQNFGGRDFANMGMNRVSGMVQVQAFDTIDAVVDIKVLLEVFVLGIVLSLISSLSAMIHIQRFSPLTILKERS